MKSIHKAIRLALMASFVACTGPLGASNDLDGRDTSVKDLSQPPDSPQEWVARYIDGALTVEELRTGLEVFVSVEALADVATQEGVFVLNGNQELDEDRVIGPSTTVVLMPDTSVTLSHDITLKNEGRLIALGKKEQPVVVTSLGTYKTILLVGGFSAFHDTHFSNGTDLVTIENTQNIEQLFNRCSFERWQDVALRFVAADGLVVRDSTFGLESHAGTHGECLNGKQSAVHIEGCTFGAMTDYADVMDLENCKGDAVPHIIGNTLLGGQDDGIDLDDCDALVAGNLIKDFWPPDPSAPFKGVNGGGITGHNSSPLIINNIILRCFHGIGFKNNARPVIVHNTIIDGNIGVSLYRTNADYQDPHGTLVNNIVVGNTAFDSGENQDLVLHGRWWPSYDPSPGDQASVDLMHNIFGVDVGGTSDRVGTMVFSWSDDLPYPEAQSLAVQAGAPLPIEVPAFESVTIQNLFASDYAGQSRSLQTPTLGALEVQP